MITKTMQKRFIESLKKYTRILNNASSRDINERDTVKIINGMLADIFGYDRYLDITSEHEIRGTYCDLVIITRNKIRYLIEAKAVGIELKDAHIKQAIDYSANQGIEWAILTNGIIWRVYKVIFEKPIDKELVFTIDFLNDNFREIENIEKLYLLSKEALAKNAIEAYHEEIKIINKFIISSIIQTDKIVNQLRRELRYYFENIKVDSKTIKNIIINDILKRELIDSEEAKLAMKKVQKTIKKKSRKPVHSEKKENNKNESNEKEQI